jgi:8-oxo-dGTP diphosphatase
MTRRAPEKVVRVAIGIVVDARGILICRRKKADSFGGYWEFPGGKIEAGETAEQAVARELLEEVGIRATPTRALEVIEHDYPKARVMLYPFICRLDEGEPVAICASEFAWVEAAALRRYRFPEANAGLIELLAGEGVEGGRAAAIDLPAADT